VGLSDDLQTLEEVQVVALLSLGGFRFAHNSRSSPLIFFSSICRRGVSL